MSPNPESHPDIGFSHDTERQEQRSLGERAVEQMHRIAGETNTALGKKMLDAHGRIKMSMFADAFGAEKIQVDRAAVSARETEWLGLDDEAIRKFHINRLGLQETARDNSPEQLAMLLKQRLEQEQQSKDGPLGEMVATMVLHRGLQEKFFVVRSAPHDDHEHGIDNVIINRATGEIVCGFDEFVGAADDPRVQEKQQKKLKAIERGGARIDYGFTVQDGRVIKQSFEHLPVFTFRLQRTEIDALLVEAEQEQTPGPRSAEALHHFLDDMTAQLDGYLQGPRVGSGMKQQLEQYRQGSLAAMRNLL